MWALDTCASVQSNPDGFGLGLQLLPGHQECSTYSCFLTSSCINQDSRIYAMWRIRPPNLTTLSQYNLPLPHADFNIEGAVLSWSLWSDHSAGKEIDCRSVTSQLPQMSKPSWLGGAGDSSWPWGFEQRGGICFGAKVCKVVSASSVVVSFVSGLLSSWVELTDPKIPKYSQAAEPLQHRSHVRLAVNMKKVLTVSTGRFWSWVTTAMLKKNSLH